MARITPSTPSASAIRGIWFVFQHAGQRFALWISSLTGKEELYLNDALVAVRRKITLTSVHELAVSDTNYSLELSINNFRRGIFKCVLRENGTAVAALETEYVARRGWQQSAINVAGAAALAYFASKAGVSFGLVVLGILALVALSYVCLGRGSGYIIRPAAVGEEA
jgi:hypothetical protein